MIGSLQWNAVGEVEQKYDFKEKWHNVNIFIKEELIYVIFKWIVLGVKLLWYFISVVTFKENMWFFILKWKCL